MAISKKGKRILWIAIPVAVLAIAALLIWLLLGQPEPEKPFEILRSQTTGNIVDCQLREGAVEAAGDGSTPQPYYTLTPPQGWTQTQEARIRYPAGGEASPDVFQSQEGVEMSFSQGSSAVLDLNSLDPATIQEVQFGDNQVIYSQTTTTAWDGAQQVSRTTTQVYWVEAQNLFCLRCYQDLDVNQMLEWVSLVSYQNPRMLAYEPPPIQPLELVRGGITQETGEDGFTLYEMEYYRSEGNPEIPESVPSYTFPQAPEGWTLLGGDTIQVGKTLEKYQNQDGEVPDRPPCLKSKPAPPISTSHLPAEWAGRSWRIKARSRTPQSTATPPLSTSTRRCRKSPGLTAAAPCNSAAPPP